MPLNIKNVEVGGRWNAGLGSRPGLGKRGGRKSLREYLEQNDWPLMPAGELGRVMSREEEDQILGYGPEVY